MEPRFDGISQSGEVYTVPDPDAVSLLGLGELLLCSAGDGPSSPLLPFLLCCPNQKRETGAGAGLHQH